MITAIGDFDECRPHVLNSNLMLLSSAADSQRLQLLEHVPARFLMCMNSIRQMVSRLSHNTFSIDSRGVTKLVYSNAELTVHI